MKSVDNFQQVIFTHLSEVLIQKLVSLWIFFFWMTWKVLAQTIFFIRSQIRAIYLSMIIDIVF